MWNNSYAKTSRRERGDNGMFAAIANGATPAPELKEVDVLADMDSGAKDTFLEACDENQTLADDWAEYQKDGLFSKFSNGKGVGSLGVLSLVAHGAPISDDGRDAAIRAACASPNQVVQASGLSAAKMYWGGDK